MEKRYQVFVSSTYEDLLEERQEVMQALLELDCMPAGMELFPAADEDQWSLIKKVIDDCDYYIVIVAGRYGSTGPDGISYTRMEYEYAVGEGKPVIAFLHKAPEKLPADRTERDPETQGKLASFVELTKTKMVKYWTTPADLGSVVSRSLVKLIKNTPAVGWVKADLLPSRSATEEILELRKKIDGLERELETSRGAAPAGTEHLAQGDDTVEIHFSFAGYQPGSYRADVSYKHSFEISWNDIFGRISPLLIDEASDGEIESALNDLISDHNRATLSEFDQVKQYELRDFEVFDDDYNTVKVQLLALDLITKSEKTRSVKDKATYWTLSAYGERVMMKLRAIKRPGYEESPKPTTSNKALETDAP